MSDTTSLIGIDLFPRSTDNLSTKVRRSAQARALVAFAKKVQDHADADLRRDVEAVADATGDGGFSKKVDGVRASLSDPQPKPRVTDQLAFEIWWSEQGDLEYGERTDVDVESSALALSYLREWQEKDYREFAFEDVARIAQGLVDSLDVRTVYLIPENALDSLIESGRCVATDDGLIDMTTGEPVPGVSCFRAKQVLAVVADKVAKKRDESVVASFFGVEPAALEGGAA